MSDNTQQAEASQQPEVEVDPVEAIKTTALAPISAIESGIADLTKKYGNVVFDVQNTKGMKDAKAARAEVRKPRYKLENLRKATASALESVKRSVNEEAESIKKRLLAIETPIDEQITAEEKRAEEEAARLAKAEEDRINAIRTQIANIAGAPARAVTKGVSAADIQTMIDIWEKPLDAEIYQEFLAEADHTRNIARAELVAIMGRLRQAEEAAAIALEREQALAAKDAEIAEKDRQLAEALALLAKLQAPKAEEPKAEDAKAEEPVAQVKAAIKGTGYVPTGLVRQDVAPAPVDTAAAPAAAANSLSADDEPDFDVEAAAPVVAAAAAGDAIEAPAPAEQAPAAAVVSAVVDANKAADPAPTLFEEGIPSVDRIVYAVATHFGVSEEKAREYIVHAGEQITFNSL